MFPSMFQRIFRLFRYVEHLSHDSFRYSLENVGFDVDVNTNFIHFSRRHQDGWSRIHHSAKIFHCGHLFPDLQRYCYARKFVAWPLHMGKFRRIIKLSLEMGNLSVICNVYLFHYSLALASYGFRSCCAFSSSLSSFSVNTSHSASHGYCPYT